MAAISLLVQLSRENLMIAALSILAGAGVVVSVGAWVLLYRERRAARRGSP